MTKWYYLENRIGVKAVVNTERDCKPYRIYQPGFTPKEHYEMMDRRFMMEREDRRDRDAQKMRIAEFIVAIIALCLVVFAAYIERGGQPTINIITPNPASVNIEQQP